MKKQILALSLCALTAMPASAAINCSVLPTCAELGYNDTVSSCPDSSNVLKCPFDQTKGKCQRGNPIIGEIRLFGGSTAPKGWMFCTGTYVSKTTYSALYAVIGNMYGSSGTTFRLPFLNGRVPIGVGTGVSSTYSLGSYGGEEKHTLTISEMPSHNHGIKYKTNKWGDNANNRPFPKAGGTDSYGPTYTEYSGGSNAHENRMPYLAVNYIIYTGVY